MSRNPDGNITLQDGDASTVFRFLADKRTPAIRSVAAGKSVIAPEIQKILRESPPIPELAERQRDILLSMSRGLTDADIATQLKLTPNSVREHITTIFNKLDAANKTEAVAIALRKHLLKI